MRCDGCRALRRCQKVSLLKFGESLDVRRIENWPDKVLKIYPQFGSIRLFDFGLSVQRSLFTIRRIQDMSTYLLLFLGPR
jgi:hypothetical protein